MIQNHVTSLSTSKRLKELGVPQVSEFYWAIVHPSSTVLPGPSWQIYSTEELVKFDSNDLLACSAFLASELGMVLPPKIHDDEDDADFVLLCGPVQGSKMWFAAYAFISNQSMPIYVYYEEEEILAEAMAKLFDHLHKNEIIPYNPMEKRHKHIWKYTTGKTVRVCEAPIPTIKSCGKEQWMTAFNGWVDAEKIIKARAEN